MGRERDTELAYSINDVPIRLTYERWFHITENHDDLASYYFEVLEAIENPEFIIRGNIRKSQSDEEYGKNEMVGSRLPGASEK